MLFYLFFFFTWDTDRAVSVRLKHIIFIYLDRLRTQCNKWDTLKYELVHVDVHLVVSYSHKLYNNLGGMKYSFMIMMMKYITIAKNDSPSRDKLWTFMELWCWYVKELILARILI